MLIPHWPTLALGVRIGPAIMRSAVRRQYPTWTAQVGAWLSLVEHLVRDQGVGGSNPLAPTILFSTTWKLLLRRDTEHLVLHRWTEQGQRSLSRAGKFGHSREYARKSDGKTKCAVRPRRSFQGIVSLLLSGLISVSSVAGV